MKEWVNNEIDPLNKIKVSGLAILILLMLFSATPAACSMDIQYELVANTTSDAEGNYVLSGIPDGNYTLVALYNEDKWRRADEQIQVQGTDPSVNLDTSSRDIDANESQALLDLKGSGVDLTGSAVISGLTRQKQMGGDLIPLGFADVLLLREVVNETQFVSSSGQNLDIAVVTGYRSHELPLKNLMEDLNSNSSLNLTFSYFMADYVMENDVDLSGMDVIYINMLSPSTAQKLTPTVDSAIANGCVVIDDDTLLNESLPLPEDQIESFREKLNNYWLNGAYDQSNLKNLVFCIASDCCGRTDLLYEDPHTLPERAIYHTNMTGYFTDSLDDYLAWYSNRSDGGHVYDPAKPTVAITMYQSYFPFQIEPIDALISELEARDYNVIATYGSDTLLSGDFFQQGDEVLVDAIISFTYFGNKFDAEELDVPVINGIVDNYMNRTEYEASSRPLPADKMMKLDLQELWGAICNGTGP